MSFISSKNGQGFEAGYFLADENCVRETKEIPQSLATTVDGAKYVKAGTVFPSNDANAVGIVYEPVDVSEGAMPGSVVTKGDIYADRLAVELADTAASALRVNGFKIISEAPAVTRP